MSSYLEIFEIVETTLKKQSKLTDIEFEERFGKFKHFENQSWSDDDYYRKLVEIAFYSGFKASTTAKYIDNILNHFPNYETVSRYDESKVSAILNDPNMIHNKRKIQACIKNAKTMVEIIGKYGNFTNYVYSFNPEKSLDNLLLLKKDLEKRFSYLGGITSFHFLTDIGLPVLKPDRVITRIFSRLGLIKNEKKLLAAIMEGRKFSDATGYPIRYIDIIFVKYGQQGNDEYYGAVSGICLKKNPKCEDCGIRKYCKY